LKEKRREKDEREFSKTITLPRLNKLNPSLESTALKIMEESGELAQAIGKFRG
jgi:NTP pyrophosphatase (non-canonical NTP hydrolase)